MRFWHGLRNGLIISLVIWAIILAFGFVAAHAEMAKVSDTEYTITNPVTTRYELKNRKDFIKNLQMDIAVKQTEITQLTNQIAALEKEVGDAEGLGVKEEVAKDAVL